MTNNYATVKLTNLIIYSNYIVNKYQTIVKLTSFMCAGVTKWTFRRDFHS